MSCCKPYPTSLPISFGLMLASQVLMHLEKRISVRSDRQNLHEFWELYLGSPKRLESLSMQYLMQLET